MTATGQVRCESMVVDGRVDTEYNRHVVCSFAAATVNKSGRDRVTYTASGLATLLYTVLNANPRNTHPTEP